MAVSRQDVNPGVFYANEGIVYANECWVVRGESKRGQSPMRPLCRKGPRTQVCWGRDVGEEVLWGTVSQTEKRGGSLGRSGGARNS